MTAEKLNAINLAIGTCFLNYHLIVNNLYNSDGSVIGESFGVDVSLRTASGHTVEQRGIPDITVSPSKAKKLLFLLEQGQVTPYALDEVVGEYIIAH